MEEWTGTTLCCWSVNMGLPMNTIGTCGQDGKVFIWTQGEPGGEWSRTLLNDFGVPVWRLSWSVMGNILAWRQSIFFYLGGGYTGGTPWAKSQGVM